MALQTKHQPTGITSRRLYFDIETNGFLDVATVCHSIVAADVDTGELFSFCDFNDDGSNKDPTLDPTTISDGLALLQSASQLIGHNIISYDVPVIKKLYPYLELTDDLEDTLILSRFLHGDIKDQDFRVREAQIHRGLPPSLPGNLLGSHSLEAWGYRLGEMKGEYTAQCKLLGIDPWSAWNVHMQRYCEQDVRVTAKLHQMLTRKPAYAESTRALWIEHEFAKLIHKQEKHGFRFDVEGAEALERKLRIRKSELEGSLCTLFPPWYANLGPRKVNKKMTRWVTSDIGALTRKMGKEHKVGYYETVDPDCAQIKVELRVFNPASRHHIADRLQKLYGWVPAEFTNAGDPVIDDEVLSNLPYPPAQALAEYFMLEKRLGQLADGKQAWLKVQKNGRIHGRVNTLGAITHRCTHSDPNIAQVPSIENAKGPVPYGAECRALFLPDHGHVLVGCDADGLELRCLAHFLRDEGRYAQIVDEGDKEKGTDIHTANQKAAGLPTRASAKTFIYAFLYGAGNEKIGEIVGGGAAEGAALKAKFLKSTKGLSGLIHAVKEASKVNGYVRGIDGRRVPVRAQHAALNSLLQNAGAIPMKLAPVLLYQRLTSEGLVWGSDWAMVAHVHDEMQLTCRPEIVDHIKSSAVWSIEEAGRQLGFNIPLRGSAAAGSSWKETH